MTKGDVRANVLLSFGVSLATTLVVIVGLHSVPGLLNVSAPKQLEVERLILRSREGRTVSEIRSMNGKTELVFFAGNGSEAMTLGVESRPSARFIRLFDDRGAVVGDSGKSNRVQLGALFSESPETRVSQWGVLVNPGSGRSGRVGVYANQRSDMEDWLGGIAIQNGKKEFVQFP